MRCMFRLIASSACVAILALCASAQQPPIPTTGFAGLANLPVIGRLFRRTSTDREKPTVLIGIRPHLLSLPSGEIESRPLRVGSEVRPHIPL